MTGQNTGSDSTGHTQYIVVTKYSPVCVQCRKSRTE